MQDEQRADSLLLTRLPAHLTQTRTALMKSWRPLTQMRLLQLRLHPSLCQVSLLTAQQLAQMR